MKGKRFAVCAVLLIIFNLFVSCSGKKEYVLTENNYFSKYKYTDLSKCKYYVRGDMFTVKYTTRYKNPTSPHGYVKDGDGYKQIYYNDAYRLIDIENGSEVNWRILYNNWYYANYYDVNISTEYNIALTAEGGEVAVFSAPNGIEVKKHIEDGMTIINYVYTDLTKVYFVMGWTKEIPSKEWSFDGEDAAFDGEFTEVPQMICDDDNRLALYFPTGKSCFVVSDYGNTIARVDVPESNGETKAELHLRDGKAILCRSYEDLHHEIFELDSENLSFSEGTTVTADPNSDEYLILNGYTIGYANENGLYGVEEGKTKCIFKWKDIGLDYEMLDEIHTIEKEKFFVIYHDEEGKLCDGVIGVLEKEEQNSEE